MESVPGDRSHEATLVRRREDRSAETRTFRALFACPGTLAVIGGGQFPCERCGGSSSDVVCGCISQTNGHDYQADQVSRVAWPGNGCRCEPEGVALYLVWQCQCDKAEHTGELRLQRLLRLLAGESRPALGWPEPDARPGKCLLQRACLAEIARNAWGTDP